MMDGKSIASMKLFRKLVVVFLLFVFVVVSLVSFVDAFDGYGFCSRLGLNVSVVSDLLECEDILSSINASCVVVENVTVFNNTVYSVEVHNQSFFVNNTLIEVFNFTEVRYFENDTADLALVAARDEYCVERLESQKEQNRHLEVMANQSFVGGSSFDLSDPVVQEDLADFVDERISKRADVSSRSFQQQGSSGDKLSFSTVLMFVLVGVLVFVVVLLNWDKIRSSGKFVVPEVSQPPPVAPDYNEAMSITLDQLKKQIKADLVNDVVAKDAVKAVSSSNGMKPSEQLFSQTKRV